MLIKPTLLPILPLLNTLSPITKIKTPECGARAHATFEAAELGFQYVWMSVSEGDRLKGDYFGGGM